MPYKDEEKNKEYHKRASRLHYLANKEEYIQRNIKARIAAKEYVYNIKKTKRCELCGENRIECLDFHHNDIKVESVCILQHSGCSIVTIDAEIKKCTVLCANCHIKFHYDLQTQDKIRKNLRPSRAKKRQWLIDYKKTKTCSHCHEDDYRCLSFHHFDSNKEDIVSNMVSRGNSLQKILEEINKCMVLCANCHRIVHKT
jgi:hypothetical protein